VVYQIAVLTINSLETARFEAAFSQAQAILRGAAGYMSHELLHCIERPEEFTLIVRWQSLDAHQILWRESASHVVWRQLLTPFYSQPPVGSHYFPTFHPDVS
jgi:heme-degrading monooxygenase HmoA